ncbi:hypothetical protein ACWT_0365 [Actinoplanes sp. SE50]|uniref:type II secretion system F family protein n=1 Tax=unclassified Actinoplanes TaxID=2626549 RepID=UPI00023EC3BE|nr:MULTISPECIES: hypothetical protein [unclassified Actinoplanes]AEV81377.1 hypothetical protein ACPL_480 [Actinoplanes sp. SE50/110]ATO79780.1 hypothetical protein ACWT_0365 [Actinoplanes sp. SE50]SLL97182.1 hypothetical protein ACSP50_0379 [Actinoplanes sp. SE50/110]
MIAVLVACLLGCAVVIAWPRAGTLARLSGRSPGLRLPRPRLPEPDRRGAAALAGATALVALVAGGPVAAVGGAVYAGIGGAAWVRRTRQKRAAAGRLAALDALSSLVADLRAGLPPGFGVPSTGLDGDERIARLSATVWRLAERTGAPAADLLERIEADARAADRARASAAAQAAGVQATSLLLAVLPVGGLGLGYAIGADSLHILLRTRLGAVCAIGALALQLAGLQWARRIANGPRR